MANEMANEMTARMRTSMYVANSVIPFALSLLPASMRSQAAKAQLLAIGLQESRFEYRRQMGNGPARGFWQFEGGPLSGAAQVLTHPACRNHLHVVLALLQYAPTMTSMQLRDAIEHNDVLAAVCARLLLAPHPDELPGEQEAEAGWQYYLACWHPGAPHRETWDAFFAEAWRMSRMHE